MKITKKLINRLVLLLFWGGVFSLTLAILGVSLWQASADSNAEAFSLGTVSASKEASESVDFRLDVYPATAPGETVESTREGELESRSFVIAYALPHPGLLPGHPLYRLKMIRDQIRLFFTNQPTRRASLLLHYADKRLAAAGVLATEGKLGLASETAAKAEMYLLRCQELMTDCESSKVLETTKGEFNWSIEKHRSVLAQLEEKLGSNRLLLEPAQRTFSQIEQARCR